MVISGGGKIGEYLASKLLRSKHQVAIIEKNDKKIEHLALVLRGKVLMVHGDGCDSVYQADAGADKADIFVATTGSDDANLVSCEIANLVFGVPRTIARVNNPKNERIFRRIGIEAVSSTSVITRLIETEAVEGAVHAIMSLTQGDLVLTEMTIGRGEHNVKIGDTQKMGKKVSEISLPQGSLLVAVGRGGSLEIINGSTVLYPGDAVICVSKEGIENQVRDVLLAL